MSDEPHWSVTVADDTDPHQHRAVVTSTPNPHRWDVVYYRGDTVISDGQITAPHLNLPWAMVTANLAEERRIADRAAARDQG